MTRLQPFIEGTKQYVVPLFQRTYSWEKQQWERLWNDLMSLYKADKPHTHFIGSVVTMPTTSVPEGVTKYLLIDGQQRLTTVFILLCFLRDQASENGDGRLSEEITNTLLVNPYKEDFDYYKLLPTQVDRNAFQSLVKLKSFDGQDKLSSAYKFFKRNFQQADIEVQKLKKIVSSNLSVVSVVLGLDDDPYLVFESLNDTGRRLTQSDLVRNFFFMKIHVSKQEDSYAKYWKPMQDVLEEKLTGYIHDYLVKDGVWVKETSVYFVLKERVGNGEALDYLKGLADFAEYYKRLLYPERYESDLAIRKVLMRLNRIGVKTAYPFLLNCYNACANNQITSEIFLQVLSIVENFVIRRFVCNVPSNQFNRIFPSLYSQIVSSNVDNFIQGLTKILEVKDYPKDVLFKTKFADSSFYGSQERNSKAKLILEAIEETYSHKEKVDFSNLTIEHVMPQSLNEKWRSELGDDWEQTHELYLHVIGNLTLTGYNSELSNSSFEDKKELLNESHLEINKYFNSSITWTKDDIDWRSHHLANIALKVWPYFGDDQVEVGDQTDVTGKIPVAVKIFGKIINVQSWSDVVVVTLNSIADLDLDKFQQIVGRFPRFFEKEKLIRGRELSNGLFVEANVSAKAAYRFCQQALEEVELTSDDWQLRIR